MNASMIAGRSQSGIASAPHPSTSPRRFQWTGTRSGIRSDAHPEKSHADAVASRAGRVFRTVMHGVKDLRATKGIPTAWGAEPFRDQVFDVDATVVRALRRPA